MLDAIEPSNDILTAVEAWLAWRQRSDPQALERAFRGECLAAGDEYALLALRCYAAGGLSDQQSNSRLLDLVGVSIPDEYSIAIGPETAAVIIARHLALCGMPARDITLALADCGGVLSGWPDDPELLIHIANNVVEEAA